MKPLQTGAPTVRLPLQQARALLEEKKWSAAQALLDDLERTSPVDRHSPEYGEWCILQARVGVAAGEYRDAVRYGRSALRIFQSTSADAALAETHRVLGGVYLGLGESKSARIHTRDALAIYRQIDDATGMMQSANDLARVHFVRGEYDLAVDHLTDAIDLARQVGNDEKGAVFTGNLGRIRLLQGRWEEAQQALDDACACAQALDRPVSVARNLLSLGYLAILRHDFATAASHLDESLRLIETANLARERAIHSEYLGWWHYEQAHWIQAKEAFRAALEMGRKLSSESDIVTQSLRGLAECEAELGDWSEARRLADEGLAVALDVGERCEVGCFYRVLTLAHAHRGDIEAARTALTRASETLEIVGDPYESARLAVVLSQVVPILDPTDSEAPLPHLNRAAALFAKLGVPDRVENVRWLQVQAFRTAGRLNDAIELARDLTPASEAGAGRGRSEEKKAVLEALSQECVQHSLSKANEFRLGGMPWLSEASDAEGDELQQAVDFYRDRIKASGVLLLEVTADGERSGRVIAQVGIDEATARRVASFAANAYQHDLPTDTPQFYWSLVGAPNLRAHLADEAGVAPLSVITVPVELGPASSGLLYADIAGNGSPPVRSGFEPRDLDFAVAFAEVVAWRSTKLRSEGLLRDVRRLRDQLGQACEFPNIITQDAGFRETLARAGMIVDADLAVLLEGETGTGKDLLARAIHYSGARRDRRFVTVNCAALPETLLESELFGVKRGAFTGADRDKTGLFEEADGGTFFLDEIGEMPFSIQAKLLRLLESKEVLRLGDTKPRPINVRVISATNCNLTDEMEKGAFRRDLYYRLTPLILVLPPLRERREDIPLLLDHYLAVVAEETGRSARLSADAVRVMCAYHWPGNVRELENEIRKIILLTEPDVVVGPDRLSRKFTEHTAVEEPAVDATLPKRFSLYDHVAQIERVFLARALTESHGVKKHAAARLGIPESTLRLKMKQYDLSL